MISASVLSAVGGGVYAVTLAVLGFRLRTVPERARHYCHVMLLVLGVSGVANFLVAAGIGGVSVGGATVTLPSFVSDVVAYSLLWYVTAKLGDVSREMLAAVTAIPVVQVAAFQFGATAGGVVGLVSSLVVVGGHVAFMYLFMGPLWRSAQDLPDARRVLFWKSRNLLLFLIGMLIVYAFLSLAVAFTTFGTALVNQYISVLIRVGFAGFLFANVDALAGDGAVSDQSGDGTDGSLSPAAFGSSPPDATD